jgi:hypothetical protein
MCTYGEIGGNGVNRVLEMVKCCILRGLQIRIIPDRLRRQDYRVGKEPATSGYPKYAEFSSIPDYLLSLCEVSIKRLL